jgi:hypothetical protein
LAVGCEFVTVEWMIDYDWDALDVALHFDQVPSEQVLWNLEETIRGWYALGARGGFGGKMHFLHESEPHLDERPPWIRWIINMGQAEHSALDPLLRALESITASGAPLARVVVGWREEYARDE